MKPNRKLPPGVSDTLRRARLAAFRFALREAGALLSVSAPLVVRAGEKLRALSEHPALAASPPFSGRKQVR